VTTGDANILILPVWKTDASAEEWLYELALLARKHPDRFSRMVLIYEEMSPDRQASRTNYYSHGLNTSELVGLIEIGKQMVWDAVRPA
jgi:hypothetical protein